jgi:hypothetical protein
MGAAGALVALWRLAARREAQPRAHVMGLALGIGVATANVAFGFERIHMAAQSFTDSTDHLGTLRPEAGPYVAVVGVCILLIAMAVLAERIDGALPQVVVAALAALAIAGGIAFGIASGKDQTTTAASAEASPTTTIASSARSAPITTVAPPPPAYVPPSGPALGTVDADTLLARDGPDEQSTVLGELHQGDTVRIYCEAQGQTETSPTATTSVWYRVENSSGSDPAYVSAAWVATNATVTACATT